MDEVFAMPLAKAVLATPATTPIDAVLAAILPALVAIALLAAVNADEVVAALTFTAPLVAAIAATLLAIPDVLVSTRVFVAERLEVNPATPATAEFAAVMVEANPVVKLAIFPAFAEIPALLAATCEFVAARLVVKPETVVVNAAKPEAPPVAEFAVDKAVFAVAETAAVAAEALAAFAETVLDNAFSCDIFTASVAFTPAATLIIVLCVIELPTEN